jgi:hypothetical protein
MHDCFAVLFDAPIADRCPVAGLCACYLNGCAIGETLNPAKGRNPRPGRVTAQTGVFSIRGHEILPN